jgi:hypothetical protein
MIHRYSLVLSIASLACLFTVPAAAAESEVVSLVKIWDAGKHNAFTDLIRWRDTWYCTFREAEGHVGGDGKLRVLASDDGQKWESVALIGETGIDLRDPKLSITPDGRLMIVAGGRSTKARRCWGGSREWPFPRMPASGPRRSGSWKKGSGCGG